MAIELEDDWIHKVEIENQLAGEALRAVLDMSESRWKPGRISLTNRATLEPLISKSASEALNELVKAYGGIIRARVTFEGGKLTGRYIDWYAEEDWEDFTGIRWEEGRNLQKIKKTVVEQ